jgi:Concanavalin A-like lectin/glucanases superfamily
MSKRYPGGLIIKTPVTPTTTSAPGVWTLEQALQYIKAGTWPLSVLSDPYFNYVTMLLHGDGTNGAQNNTFLDSSTNNFSITRNGNTTQGSFSPYGSNWSNYFSGSGDYLTLANNSAFALPGDFTIELWAYFNSNTTAVFCGNINSSGYGDWAFFYNNAAGVRFLTDNSSTVITGAYTVTVGVWTHFAISRSGTSVKIFANGVLLSTTTNSSSNGFAGTMYIGRANDAGLQFPGYMSNLRIVKGTAVYTSAFTPPTTPLTAISGTSLLTCQSNRFIDNSTNAFTITVNGTPSIQRFSPFSPSSAYSTSTIGGSGYFDGSGDYLTLSSNSSMDFGTGNFTIEGWFFTGDKSISAGASRTIIGNSGNSYTMQVYISTAGYMTFGNTGSTFLQGATDLANNSWHHFAISRSGTGSNQIAMWVDGTRVAQGTNSQNYVSGTIYLGSFDTANGFWNGYISNLRIVKGTAVYDPTQTTITVPTAPLTAVSNTQLLCNMTNGGIFDNAMMNNLETVGNAQISTSVFKYGTGSMSLSASGNTLRTQYNNPSLSMGTGDFTIEGWVYLSSTPSTNGVFQMSGTSGGFVNNQTANLALGTNSSSTWQIYAKNTYTISSSTTIPVGSWIHFALVRSGTTTVLYINGTALITLTADSTNYSTPYIGLGSIYDATSYPLGGYIDDLRITKGYARYTSNFTPPAAAFPNQ